MFRVKCIKLGYLALTIFFLITFSSCGTLNADTQYLKTLEPKVQEYLQMKYNSMLPIITLSEYQFEKQTDNLLVDTSVCLFTYKTAFGSTFTVKYDTNENKFSDTFQYPQILADASNYIATILPAFDSHIEIDPFQTQLYLYDIDNFIPYMNISISAVTENLQSDMQTAICDLSHANTLLQNVSKTISLEFKGKDFTLLLSKDKLKITTANSLQTSYGKVTCLYTWEDLKINEISNIPEYGIDLEYKITPLTQSDIWNQLAKSESVNILHEIEDQLNSKEPLPFTYVFRLPYLTDEFGYNLYIPHIADQLPNIECTLSNKAYKVMYLEDKSAIAIVDMSGSSQYSWTPIQQVQSLERIEHDLLSILEGD